MTNPVYYDIKDDFAAFPDAWAFLIWSKRGPGKTYSVLRYMIENDQKFMFVKRTIKDIDILCADGSKRGVNFDVSPFKPLNRDFGWNIKPVKIISGIAGFYNSDEDGKPYGDPVGYCAALGSAKDVKGFEMSDAGYMIFDEFIPKKGERINRGEGEQLLEMYMTLRRDRILRGRDDLKLVCLANATSVNNPTFSVLDVVDDVVTMDVRNIETNYISDRRILLHSLDPKKYVVESEPSGIELAMSGTAWADMALEGHFAYDDFSAVKHDRLKGYKPLCSYTFKKKDVYIYYKDGGYYYATSARTNTPHHYNLARENEQKKFYFDFVMDLYNECIEDRMKFETFTMYDLIVNYKKIFII